MVDVAPAWKNTVKVFPNLEIALGTDGVPIMECAHCKNSWKRHGSWISESPKGLCINHGICPQCLADLKHQLRLP